MYPNPRKALASIILALLLATGPALAARTQERPKKTNSLGMTFIEVLPGTFMMGSPPSERFRNSDEHLHEVTVTATFYLQETEVTFGQWQAVMGRSWMSHRKGPANLPVTKVSWYDCIRFIKKLNTLGEGHYRLPTEAEWEYACRAGTQTAYSWGNDIDCAKAVFGNNVKKEDECTLYYQSLQIPLNGPAPVARFAPNPWGFYDMHGNVWEWCADPYSDYLSGSDRTGAPGITSESRVRRGGSWFKFAQYLRSANRTYAHPASKFKTTGFRLVLEAE